MVSTADLLFVVLGLVGVSMVGMGVYSNRRWDEPGVASFAALTITLGTIFTTSAVLWPSSPDPSEGTVYWSSIISLLMPLAALPWALFSMRYTGRLRRLDWKRVLLITLPVFPIYATAPAEFDIVDGKIIVPLLVTLQLIASLYIFSLILVGCYVHVRSAWSYAHIPLGQGVTIALTPIVIYVTAVVSGSLLESESYSQLDSIGLLLVGALLAAATLLISLFWYQMFDSTPAAGSIGKQEVTRQMDDMVVVTDHRERVIEVNEAVGDKLDVTDQDVLGESIESLLDMDIDAIRASEEMTLHTTQGHRQFDAQVSEVTDQHDRWLGFIVTLHDVTQREIREQRLEVLNRILRHNLRNKLTIVKGQAAVVAEGDTSRPIEHIGEEITEASDELLELSERARDIEKLMHASKDESHPFSLQEVIQSVVDDIQTVHPTVEIETDIDGDPTVYADEGLLTHVLWNVVENGAVHNDASRPSVSIDISVHPDQLHQVIIEVSDNGPGIPDTELEVIRAGRETDLDHTSGLGLWATSWGVKQLGGELAFEENTPRGTVVRIELPSVLFSGGERRPASTSPERESETDTEESDTLQPPAFEE